MDIHATPLGPAMKSTGTDTTRSLLDGHAVQAEFCERPAFGESSYHELTWLDSKTGRIGYSYVGDNGFVATAAGSASPPTCQRSAHRSVHACPGRRIPREISQRQRP